MTPGGLCASVPHASDCHATCETVITLLMECPPDQVWLEASIAVSTADGRLDEVVSGEIEAYVGRDDTEETALVWRATAFHPMDALSGRLDPDEIDPDHCRYGDETSDDGVMFWWPGADSELREAYVDVVTTIKAGRQELTCRSNLGEGQASAAD